MQRGVVAFFPVAGAACAGAFLNGPAGFQLGLANYSTEQDMSQMGLNGGNGRCGCGQIELSNGKETNVSLSRVFGTSLIFPD